MPAGNPTPNRMIATTVVESATDRKKREMIQERVSMGAIVKCSMYYYFDISPKKKRLNAIELLLECLNC